MKSKKYRWNVRKFLSNLTVLAVMMGTGLLIGWIFAMWIGGAA